jgi:hypothetical protein
VFGIRYTKDVSSVLYQSMLEASSCSEERPAGFAGELDAFERAEHAPVGARRGTPKDVEPSKSLIYRSTLDLRGSDPFDPYRCREEISGMFQGVIGRPVRFKRRIEIAYYTHLDFRVHQSSSPFRGRPRIPAAL